MAYYFYLALGVLCFIGEMFTFDFSLACFGTGLFGAALVSWLGLGLGWQVAVFIIASLGLFFRIRPLALKHLYHKSKHIKTNVDALIGRKVLVTMEPDEETMIGRVQVDGDSWRAHFPAKVKANEHVIVEKLEGNTLFVTLIKMEEVK
ncbi:MAG: NfeD family protein [Elusimicrobiaceae bacterium]|nr:NfeD family protein [Elusimicrobiaceae bacterium]